MQRKHTPMDLRLGTPVLHRYHQGYDRLGHIDGFARNALGDPIVAVRWDDGEVSDIHPDNLELNPTEWPDAWPEKKCLDLINARDRALEARTRAPKPRSLFRRFFTFAA
jgi:hypothetical protein